MRQEVKLKYVFKKRHRQAEPVSADGMLPESSVKIGSRMTRLEGLTQIFFDS